ncbi:Alcohol dehydrogenase superfamily, zinc-type [Niveomyces insectorum RCEF 264]|uniref:Alcohol dehydrogenase superfamily, zinc-type n=1 Tax=Niveomyces insectorum RCEF 264 TaxID=1081102 RepID=A0A167ZSZ7_9HYPO|nr:Alcohol dehydrogenase superfamily, zinc-type [Niveomyces insectorum RCEF 264]
MANPAPPSDDGTMLAAVLERFGAPYTLKRVPRPGPPQGHDLVIKVLAASYCHTDAVFAAGNMSHKALPRVGSHEFAGEIVAMGPLVVPGDRGGLDRGVRVGVVGLAYHPCGVCYECTHSDDADIPGYSVYCPRATNLGLSRDGGFQEYCLVDSRQVAPLPVDGGGLSAVQAAPMMCAGLTIWAALQHPRVRAACCGAWCGTTWVATAAAAVATGATDDQPNSERGVDAAIVLPEAQEAFDTGMALLRNHGTLVVVSFPPTPFALKAQDVVFRDIAVVGTLLGSQRQLRDMLAFCTAHGVAAQVRTFPLRQVNELVEEYHRGFGGKLVVDMTL